VLVDTHCHLHLLGAPAEQLLAEAAAAGVGHVVDVGIDLPSSEAAAANAARLAGVSATAGIHPNSADEATDEALAAVEALLARPQVVAVGETGLDNYRDHTTPEVQRRAFAAHAELAKRTGKALVVHCRDAFEDVLAVLERVGAPGRVVFHCFTGDAAMAARIVEAGWVVSFSGTVTFKNAPDQRAACAVVPLERMVLETDSPFLSPHPYRGQPNRPGRVALTAATVAQVHGVDLDTVAAATSATAARTFGLALEPRRNNSAAPLG
jgi:TatD DNase family protein